MDFVIKGRKYQMWLTFHFGIFHFLKYMLMCAIVIIKDHKMKQILNDLPKIIPQLYLSSSII